MTQSAALGSAADVTGLGVFTVSGSPIVAGRSAFGGTALYASLGSGAGSIVPAMTIGLTIGSATDRAGFRLGAGGEIPVVTQSAALGSAADVTGLGVLAISGSPIVLTGQLCNLHRNSGHSKGNIIEILIEHVVIQNVENDRQRAGGALVDATLESHQNRIGRHIAGIIGHTNENLGRLSKAGLTKVQIGLQVGVDAGAVGDIGQPLGDHQSKHNATQFLYLANGNRVGDGVAHIYYGLIRYHQEIDGSTRRNRHCANYQAYQHS